MATKARVPPAPESFEDLKRTLRELLREAPKSQSPKVPKGQTSNAQDAPKAKHKTVLAASQTEAIEEGKQRLVVDMSADLHKAMKLRAVQEGRTIRAYVLEVLKRDMKQWNPKRD